MTKNEFEIMKLANNALYFDDSSDYSSALWDILKVLKPDLDDYHKFEFEDKDYQENQDNSFSEAIEVIRGEFAKDKDLGSIYHTWQANLAMTIFDNSGIPVKQCNDIAMKFLDKLINGG